ncbi:hypothetical protein OROGR_002604 [Orobanche gracilis]
MATTSSVSLKLLIDTQAKRVLFAEAGKDCVDFLFYILSLPVSKLITLVGKQGMVGSLANLYESIENLNDSYVQPNQSKDTLLKTAVSPAVITSVPLLAIQDAPDDHGKKFYRCGNCSTIGRRYNGSTSHVSDDPRAICPDCRGTMTQTMQYVAPPAAQPVASTDEGGFVKGMVTYMVMDDLVVKPLSTISSITLLNKFNVKDVGALEEKVVNLGMTEAVKMLKASLERKNVLTCVFLNGRR